MYKINRSYSRIIGLGICISIALSLAFSVRKAKPDAIIITPLGTIEIQLYDETPLHKENFIALSKQGFYDSLLFHRVISQFMIQTGDPLSKHAKPNQMLGMGDINKTIPAEFIAHKIHKKGAVAAARLSDNQNPQKESSGCQFYIVQGRTYTKQELENIENQRIEKMKFQILKDYLMQEENTVHKEELLIYQKDKNTEAYNTKLEEINNLLTAEYAKIEEFRYTDEEKLLYETIGGAPHLDYEYSVFGEVTKGLQTVDKIAQTETKRDRPTTDIRIEIRLIK